MAESSECAFFLISLLPDVPVGEVLSKVSLGPTLIRGVPHGWVLQPHGSDAASLISHQWDLFLLTAAWNTAVESVVENRSTAYIKGTVSMGLAQYDRLIADVDKKAVQAKDTPPLPQEWTGGHTGFVPTQHVLPAKAGAPKPGELKLYEPMVTYLSTALPDAVRDKPVSLFNLFKYSNGDAFVHERYMQGFKDRFGPAAGAQLKFMGPISSQPKFFDAPDPADEGHGKMSWQDANIVQYDSIWHYAYMLSTDVYAELNKEKVRGLEDTCILLISEIELQE